MLWVWRGFVVQLQPQLALERLQGVARREDFNSGFLFSGWGGLRALGLFVKWLGGLGFRTLGL